MKIKMEKSRKFIKLAKIWHKNIKKKKKGIKKRSIFIG